MSAVNPAEQASGKALNELFQAIDRGQCFRLEAGAGAGKTYSLIKSLKRLIDQKSVLLLKAEQKIACITYTNVAKKEILDRTDNHPVIFSDTIHAFCWSFLQGFQVKLRELIPSLSDKWTERVKESCGINDQKIIYDFGFPSINEMSISLHHDDVVALMAQLLEFTKFQNLLRNKFPIIFIDEYQDTNIDLADSIVRNLIDNESGVIVGLFGDHWQKIYGSEACGLVESEAGKIIEIGKKANFRSDKNIVECLNRMRPELPQSEADPNSFGSICVYHSNAWNGSRRTGVGGGHWTGDLPEDDAKAYLEKVRSLMLAQGWDMNPEKTKVLMLTNNVIATEQKFKSLADCFKYTDDYLKKADKYIRFFLEVLEPTAVAFENKDYGELFQVIRQKIPHLTKHTDKKVWSNCLSRLLDIRENGTIGDMLDFLYEYKIPRLPNKVEQSETKYRSLREEAKEELDESDKKLVTKLNKIRSVHYQEVINLGEYIDEKTPFSTKHGVKGAEFDNVLIVCGRGWNKYNWNQMLEWFDGSFPKDKRATFERNRNLFYVACSRAKHNLTLLFTQELSDDALLKLGDIFGARNMLGDAFSAGL